MLRPRKTNVDLIACMMLEKGDQEEREEESNPRRNTGREKQACAGWVLS
jgi:hypothetical protein